MTPPARKAALMDPIEALMTLIGSANYARKQWVWEQYDSQVMADTVRGSGLGAGFWQAVLLRLKETLDAGAQNRLARGLFHIALVDDFLAHAVSGERERKRDAADLGIERVAAFATGFGEQLGV